MYPINNPSPPPPPLLGKLVTQYVPQNVCLLLPGVCILWDIDLAEDVLDRPQPLNVEHRIGVVLILKQASI